MLDPPSPPRHFHSFQMKVKTEGCLCAGCCEPITDKYLLQVSGRTWHTGCLRCTVCQLALDRETSCFVRDLAVYCKADYAKSFGAKCSKCSRGISSRDWVRKAREHVYHLACFACEACKRQLSTGEEFALHEDRVLCKAHYMETVDGATTSSDEGGDSESYHNKSKAKRVRTTFTEEQLQVLQANFQLDSNPDGQDLERIAQITGLSKRVTQVWFQNSRARQKKHMHTGKTKGGAGGGLGGEPFGRHINIQLTYSFQQQSSKSSPGYQPQHPHRLDRHYSYERWEGEGGRSHDGQGMFRSTAAKSMSETSSLDELSQESILMCPMRGEGV